MKTPKILSEKTKLRGSAFKIISAKIKLPNKKIVNWDASIWKGDSVSVVPIDDNNNIYFSKEWRLAWKRKITQIPSGGIKANSTEKEKIKQARNELREEIGLDAKKIEKLTTALLSSRIKNKMHIYLATGLFKSPKKTHDEEIIEIVKMPFKKADKIFLTGKKETTCSTIIGMIIAKEKLKIK